MAVLLHEIWETLDEQGQVLTACCLAGPDGDGLRRHLMQEAGARMVRTFEAGSNYEAVTIYYRLTGSGIYTTDHAWDLEPYPDESLERQRSVGPSTS